MPIQPNILGGKRRERAFWFTTSNVVHGPAGPP